MNRRPKSEKEKKEEVVHKKAVKELNELENNENTAALAALPDLLAYTEDVQANIIGSGESREEIAEKKAEEEAAH